MSLKNLKTLSIKNVFDAVRFCMLVSTPISWWHDQHLQVVTNWFCLQHPSPQNINIIWGGRNFEYLQKYSIAYFLGQKPHYSKIFRFCRVFGARVFLAQICSKIFRSKKILLGYFELFEYFVSLSDGTK